MKRFLEASFWSEEQMLAREVETRARALNGLAPVRGGPTAAIIDRLRSAQSLLDRALAGAPSPAPTERVSEAPHVDAGRAEPAAMDSSKVTSGLISLADYLHGAVTQAESRDATLASSIFSRLVKVLGEHGIEVLNSTGPFHVETQRVVDTVPTDDPDRDRTIQATVRLGFRTGARLLRPQEVVVFSMEAAR